MNSHHYTESDEDDDVDYTNAVIDEESSDETESQHTNLYSYTCSSRQI